MSILQSGSSGPDEALGTANVSPAGYPNARKLVSLHIGVNSVDPNQYEGWNGQLNGCENDALTMKSISEAEGFSTKTLFTSEATADNILRVISETSANLATGDFFLLTYAGHGAQVPNVNGDHELNKQDQTWVTHNRMLLDDELEQAFSAFAPGVNIVLVSDSCHSGTVHRAMFDPAQLVAAERKLAYYAELEVPRAANDHFPRPRTAQSRDGSRGAENRSSVFESAAAQFSEVLRNGGWKRQDGSRSNSKVKLRPPRLGKSGKKWVPGKSSIFDVGDSAASRGGAADSLKTRNMPFEINALVVATQASRYAGIQEVARARGQVQANGLLISGCMDNQLSMEAGGSGVFTTALKQVWNNNTFTGDYERFHEDILSKMGPTQTPVLSPWGSNPGVLLDMTPFG